VRRLSFKPFCPDGAAPFPHHSFTRPMAIRSVTYSAEPIAKRSKRPFASYWHPTRVPLLESEVASSGVTATFEPPNSDISVLAIQFEL
jgi:hypothetical protein